jgi:hypothetical protein
LNPSSAPDTGNRLVFKPSPLLALRKVGAQPEGGETPRPEGPLEVKAAPLANARRPERAHEDLTTFSTAPLPVPPPPPAAEPAAPTSETPQPEPEAGGAPRSSAAARLVLLAVAIAVLLIIATMWPESLGLR